ncbi:transthyretin [Synchiropus picturatus]
MTTRPSHRLRNTDKVPHEVKAIHKESELLALQEQHGGSDTTCPLTVKVLDAVKGTPAGQMGIKVYRKSTEWVQVAAGYVPDMLEVFQDISQTHSCSLHGRMTDAAGEIHNMITEQEFPAGLYRVEFDTKAYWLSEGTKPFHEVADVVFEAHADGHRHYILALLLSPYSFTTTAVITNPHQ